MLYWNEKKLEVLDKQSIIHFFVFMSGELLKMEVINCNDVEGNELKIKNPHINIICVGQTQKDELNRVTEVLLNINQVKYIYTCHHANNYCCSSKNLKKVN